MKSTHRGPLWRISVTTTAEASEAVAALVQRLFGEPAVSYTDLESGRTTVSAYCERKPAWSNEARQRLRAGLRALEACGLIPGPGTATLRRIRRQDWAEAWKRHFHPIEIGGALLVKPSWSRRRPRRGQVPIVLDPGLSFGTGHHPTTGFCLEELVAQREPGRAQSVLDIGTGSGILAIAAAKLGYAPIEAFDYDPDSVAVAGVNARKNRVFHRLSLRRQDVARLPDARGGRFDVVCANLIANVLLSARDRIVARLALDGVLLLAGILEREFAQVQAAYEAAGLRLARSRVERDWRSGAFQRRS